MACNARSYSQSLSEKMATIDLRDKLKQRL